MKFWAALTAALALSLCGCKQDVAATLREGHQFAREGRLDDAVLRYKKVLQTNPNLVEAHYALGTVRARQGNKLDAFTDFTNALGLSPEDHDSMVAMADLVLPEFLANPADTRNLYKRLAEISQTLLNADPQSFDGLRIKGYLAWSDQRYGDAAEAFRAAGTLRPNQPEVQLGVAQSELLLAHHETGVRTLRELIARDPDYFPAYDTLYIHYRSLNQPVLARAVVEEKIARNPGVSTYILQLTEHLLEFGDSARAQVLLQSMLADSKTYPDAPAEIGRFYFSRADWTNARRYFEQGLARGNANQRYEQLIAAVEVKLGRTTEALQILDRLLLQDASDSVARTQRGSLYLASPDAQQRVLGLADLKMVFDQQPKSPEAIENLGNAYLVLNDVDNARKSFLKALKSAGPGASLLLALANLNLRQASFADAVSFAQQTLDFRPKNTEAMLIRGVARIGLGDLNQARQDLQTIVNMSPEPKEAPEAWLQMGMLDLAAHRFHDAQLTFERLYKPGNPDIRALRSLVLLAQTHGQPDRALQLIATELGRQPDSEGLWRLMTEASIQAGRVPLAVEFSRGLATRKPEASAAHELFGTALLQSGDAANAANSLLQAVSLAGESKIRREVLVLLATALQGAGRSKEASAYFERALALDPEDPVLLNNYAYFLAQNGSQLDTALIYAQKAAKTTASPDFQDTAGWVLLRQQKLAAAIQTFEGLVHAYPQHSVYRYHLALALYSNGDREQARLQLSKAKNLPATREISQQIEQLHTLLRN